MAAAGFDEESANRIEQLRDEIFSRSGVGDHGQDHFFRAEPVEFGKSPPLGWGNAIGEHCQFIEIVDDLLLCGLVLGLLRLARSRTNKICGAVLKPFRKAESDKHACSQPRANHIAMVACLISLFAGSIGTLAILAGCDAPVSTPPVSQDERQSSSPVVAKDDLKQRQADFLNRIREADPQHRTIDRAMLNEQNELGLILDRSVEMDKVPELMRTILSQMAREFPGPRQQEIVSRTSWKVRDDAILTYAPITRE